MAQEKLINVLKSEFIPYAGEILINNLPTIDGCLSVHKKVLWGMHLNKVNHNKPFIKMLRASSYAMIFYVMGDQPLTGAMKNMANNSLNYFYLDPKGSFGDKRRKTGVGASPRYIECKISEYGHDMLKGVEKNNVPTKRNYDNTEDEIVLLPSMIPNILTNTSQSIAVGESSKIPSHNLNEVCDSIISYINTNDIGKSIDLLKGADFSIGGQILYNKETFRQIYETGRGSFTLLGNYVYDEKESKITITEVPYETYIEDIENKVREHFEKGNLKEVIDTHDGTDKDGIKLDIYLKKNTNIDQFIAKLRKYTPYESKFPCNFTVLDLDCKTPMLMSLKDIITKWIQHRHNCIINETIYDINAKSTELHKMCGLRQIANDLDTAIAIIRSSKSEQKAIEGLINHFNLTEEQSRYISTIRLININNEWIFKKIKNIEDLENEVKSLEDFKSDKSAIDKLIISQLEEVKNKYGTERQTKLIVEDTLQEISATELIEDYNCYVSISKEGYLYKYLRKTDNFKLKDGDEIIKTEITTNKATLLVFTSLGNCYKLFLHDIAEKLASVLGHYLPSLIQLEKNEEIISVQVVRKYSGNLINCFANGKLLKLDISAFKTEQKRTKLKNAISLDSELINQFIITEDIDIICKSSIDKVLVCNTSNFNAKSSKNSGGDALLKSKNDSTMVLCEPLDNIDLDKIESVDYYRANRNSVGSYQKKQDIINLKNN